MLIPKITKIKLKKELISERVRPEFTKLNPKKLQNKNKNDLSSSEQSISISVTNKENRNEHNSFISEYNSVKKKIFLPPLNKSPNKKNYINLTNNNSNYNLIYKSNNNNSNNNILSSKNSKCKIIPIIKHDKLKTPNKNKIPKPLNILPKNNSSNKLLSYDKTQYTLMKLTKKSSSRQTKYFLPKNNTPPHKLYLDCFNPQNFTIKKAFGYSRSGLSELGKIKTNQDTYLILSNIFNLNYNILGILDGHGNDGHYVSQFIKDEIIKIFSNEDTYNINKNNKNDLNEEIIYKKLTKNNFTFIKNTFIQFDKKLQNENFDSNQSGTTCILIFQISKYLICANTGDSRCILIKKSSYINNNKIYNLTYENLSKDHKPNNPNEKKRIIEKGGEVHQDLNSDGDFEGVFRIYEKGEKFPGLAVSRTIGDMESKSIGNISEPDVIMKCIDFRFKCVVLASDGLWDVMNGDDVINEINCYFKKNDFYNYKICESLVNKGVFKWGNSIGRDDISAVVGIIKGENETKNG